MTTARDVWADAQRPSSTGAPDSTQAPVSIPSFWDDDGKATADEAEVDWSSVEAQVAERDLTAGPYQRRYRNT